MGQTIEVSQRVESDATSHWVEITPHSSGSSVSFGLSAEVTQLGDRVASLDTEDIGNQRHGQVQDFIAAVEASLDIVEAIVLPVEVIGDCVPATHKVEELSSESEMWRDAILEESRSLHL